MQQPMFRKLIISPHNSVDLQGEPREMLQHEKM